MPKSLETLLLTDGLMSNTLADFVRLFELIHTANEQMDDIHCYYESVADTGPVRTSLEQALDILVQWLA